MKQGRAGLCCLVSHRSDKIILGVYWESFKSYDLSTDFSSRRRPLRRNIQTGVDVKSFDQVAVTMASSTLEFGTVNLMFFELWKSLLNFNRPSFHRELCLFWGKFFLRVQYEIPSWNSWTNNVVTECVCLTSPWN